MSDFKAKMHQNRFRLGLRPSAGEAYSASPRVANSPGLTRILRVSAFDLRSSGLVLQSPGYTSVTNATIGGYGHRTIWIRTVLVRSP